MTLRITQYGESILHDKGKAVSDFSDELFNLSCDMIEAMRGAEGIGLAAQQVGQALRFCVVEVPDHPDYPITCILDDKPLSPALLMPMPLANPKIEFLPSDEFYYEEGCLSLPEIKGDVARPELIRVEFQDLDGVPHVLECDGLLARCIQHEVDHLDGILFIDRMEKPHFAQIRDEVRALRKKTQACLKEGNLPSAYPE
jgi:peptide deformylase